MLPRPALRPEHTFSTLFLLFVAVDSMIVVLIAADVDVAVVCKRLSTIVDVGVSARNPC